MTFSVYLVLIRLLTHRKNIIDCLYMFIYVFIIRCVDGTVRVWKMSEALQPTSTIRAITNSEVLKPKATSTGSNQSITAMDWNESGTEVGAGLFDGRVVVWGEGGDVKRSITHHTAPISCVKFSSKGDSMLVTCVDSSATIWDPETGLKKQTYQCHKGMLLAIPPSHSTLFLPCRLNPAAHHHPSSPSSSTHTLHRPTRSCDRRCRLEG